ncbi:AraC family transcriptional regulator ligand-binding domain-containing protein [Microbulbifer sp. ANSA002]|uniref:AraC family transcriptional regulator ligand-binding domain-containing protein n=1 Tax=unclassified Microbulbifer TaxID=2619833 RepID=UPI004041B26E
MTTNNQELYASEPTGLATSTYRHVLYWQHLGFPKDKLKNIYGDHYSEFQNLQHRVPVRLTGQALQEVSDYFSDNTIAFRTGLDVSISSIQAFAHVLMACPTVRHLVSLGTQFQQLGTQGYQGLFSEGNERSSFDILIPSFSPLTTQQVELNIGVIFKLISDIVVDYESCHPVIHFAHHNSELMNNASSLINIPIEFGHKKNCISFDNSILDKQLCSPGKTSLDFNKLTAKKQLQKMKSDESLPNRCKDIIKDYLSEGAANLDFLADILQINKRSLQIRLNAQNTSFRRLLDLARREKLNSLDIQSMDKLQVAKELGFSTIIAYEESYKRWKNI